MKFVMIFVIVSSFLVFGESEKERDLRSQVNRLIEENHTLQKKYDLILGEESKNGRELAKVEGMLENARGERKRLVKEGQELKATAIEQNKNSATETSQAIDQVTDAAYDVKGIVNQMKEELAISRGKALKIIMLGNIGQTIVILVGFWISFGLRKH